MHVHRLERLPLIDPMSRVRGGAAPVTQGGGRPKISLPEAGFALYAALEDGVRKGLVRRSENGLEYTLTDKGREYVAAARRRVKR
jgi:hypothetical protein